MICGIAVDINTVHPCSPQHHTSSASHSLHIVSFNILLGIFTNTNMHRADSQGITELKSWYSKCAISDGHYHTELRNSLPHTGDR